MKTFDLVWCDWSSIEARMLPWLSLDPRGDERLATFRRGEDIYLKTASDILGRKVTAEDEFERQAYGKVPELSLGFLGGEGALSAMAKNYGVKLESTLKTRIVRGWREANPWAMDFGKAAETAAMHAIKRPGSSYSAGRLEYVYDTDAFAGMGALFCILPSGREIPYPGARIEPIQTKWGAVQLGITARKGAWRPAKDETEWPRVSVWRGLLLENPTQAASADLLMLALVRAERAGLAICMHTHDEIVIETTDILHDAARLKAIMEQRPGWQGDDALPLRAEYGYGFRYKVKAD